MNITTQWPDVSQADKLLMISKTLENLITITRDLEGGQDFV